MNPQMPTADAERAGLQQTLWLAALLALLTATALLRPLLPIDETRYVGVAWEMWARGDFLVPFRNGEPYHHKPPMLFWLIHAGWAVFGVNEWWPRLISPLFAAATLALLPPLAQALFPGDRDTGRAASFVLLASMLYTYFASALMFDVMLSFFVVLGHLGLVRAWRSGGGAPGFALFGLGIGGALYAKGPVALVHLLPLALAAPWWMREDRPRWGRWYAGTALALLGGAALILAWAVPAGLAGGEAFRQAIFWGQTAGRMVESFSHRAPWWTYLVALPLLLAPWLLWPRPWIALARGDRSDSGTRFLFGGLLVCFVFFSAISGKRYHYLLPAFPLFALLLARALCASPATPPRRWSLAVPAAALGVLGIASAVAAPVLARRLDGLADAYWLLVGGAGALACAAVLLARPPAGGLADVRRIGIAAVLAVAATLLGFDIAMREPYDMAAVGQRLAQYEREGRPVAREGRYHNEWAFAGRLRQPLTEVPESEVAAWLRAHPTGRVVMDYKNDAELPPGTRIEYTRRYRGGRLAILSAQP